MSELEDMDYIVLLMHCRVIIHTRCPVSECTHTPAWQGSGLNPAAMRSRWVVCVIAGNCSGFYVDAQHILRYIGCMGAIKSPVCSKNHAMSGKNVGYGRKATGKAYRYCVQCSRDRVKLYRADKKTVT